MSGAAVPDVISVTSTTPAAAPAPSIGWSDNPSSGPTSVESETSETLLLPPHAASMSKPTTSSAIILEPLRAKRTADTVIPASHPYFRAPATPVPVGRAGRFFSVHAVQTRFDGAAIPPEFANGAIGPYWAIVSMLGPLGLKAEPVSATLARTLRRRNRLCHAAAPTRCARWAGGARAPGWRESRPRDVPPSAADPDGA